MKVLIFGNAGSGKSTLARRLGTRHGLAVLDLDNVVWVSSQMDAFRPDAEIVADLDAFVRDHPAWVVEGCYGRWIEHLSPHCTEIVFCNPPEEACLDNCRRRPWEPNKFKTKEEQDRWLPALLDWVRAYYTREGDLSLAEHRRLYDAFPGPKQETRSNEETASAMPQSEMALTEFVPCTTERLVLRRFAMTDAPAFHAYRNDPEVARFQGWSGCSPAEAEEFVSTQQAQSCFKPGEWFQIAIASKTSGQLIGDCGVRIHASDARQATIGVTLARAHQGKGFATEALSCLFDQLFAGHALHRITADTDLENIAMQRLAERLGMRREGHSRQSLWFKGRWADEYLYAVLRDEWRAAPIDGARLR